MRFSSWRSSETTTGRLRTRRVTGFTLIEILIALFVLAAAALIFAVVYPSGARARAKAEYYANAVALAQQKMEESRNAGYTSLAIQGPTDTAITSFPSGNLRYTVTQYATDIKKVEVLITWSGYGGVGGTVQASTLISNHG